MDLLTYSATHFASIMKSRRVKKWITPHRLKCVDSCRISGKLLILGILTLAALLAGAGWWFRYKATHQAARFWGPQAVRLIRDAPRVVFRRHCNRKLARSRPT